LDEERRLFYVGITRAKDKLYLVRALQRGGRGYSEPTEPSRFLEDIPPNLLDGRARGGHRSSYRSRTETWTAPSHPAPAPIKQARFRAGMRVRHPIWGEGIVLDSRLQSDDETVDVVFESVGIKRLAASLANLSAI